MIRRRWLLFAPRQLGFGASTPRKSGTRTSGEATDLDIAGVVEGQSHPQHLVTSRRSFWNSWICSGRSSRSPRRCCARPSVAAGAAGVLSALGSAGGPARLGVAGVSSVAPGPGANIVGAPASSGRGPSSVSTACAGLQLRSSRCRRPSLAPVTPRSRASSPA